MHTSSSAKRTCRLSRSASEYTATVWMPSSRHARITRSAISPRLAIRTFLNMPGCDRGVRLFLVESGPRLIARAGNALHVQRELGRARRIEQGAFVRDDALPVPLHQRLVERLHAILHRSLFDEVGNVER